MRNSFRNIQVDIPPLPPCPDALDNVSHQALGSESPDDRDDFSFFSNKDPNWNPIISTPAWLCGFLFCSFPKTRFSRRMEAWCSVIPGKGGVRAIIFR